MKEIKLYLVRDLEINKKKLVKFKLVRLQQIRDVLNLKVILDYRQITDSKAHPSTMKTSRVSKAVYFYT